MSKKKDKWIAGAIAHPGALRDKLHVKAGHNIPKKKIEKALHSNNVTTRRQATLLQTLKHLRSQ